MIDRKCANCLWWSANQKKPDVAEGMFPCFNPDVGLIDVGGENGTDCRYFMGADALEVNVPNHTRKGDMIEANPNPVDGRTEIFIVTYWKDFPWLRYCLKSIERFCRGFAGVRLLIPRRDLERFHTEVANEFRYPEKMRLRVQTYHEAEGKGMVQHMALMARADQFIEPDTKYVLHADADCIFKMPTIPEHYFWNDKPYQIIRTWESLTTEDPRNPGSKIVSDCAQWREPTRIQLGFDSPWYTMCMNTAVFPRAFYRKYRDHIENVHKRDFDDVILSGRNEFPQTSMDWTAMGAYAERHMHDAFTWFDVERPPYPADRKQAFWSHGGITPEAQKQIDELLSRWVPDEHETARMKE